MIRNSLNRQGFGLSGSWSRTPASLPDLSQLSSGFQDSTPQDSKAKSTSTPAATTGVDYGAIGTESKAQPGAQLRDPRDPFEAQAASQMTGALKTAGISSLAKGATTGVMASLLGAPAAIASQVGMQGVMPGIATGVGLVSKGISNAVASNRARNAYGPIAADMGLYSSYTDDTNPRAYTRDEVQTMDATRFGLEQQARISKNPISAIFGDLPAYDPLTRGFVSGEDDPYGGGVDDGSYSGEGRTSRGMRGDLGDSPDFGGMGTMGNMDSPAGGYGEGGYNDGGGDSDSSGDSGGRGTGNSDQGGGRSAGGGGTEGLGGYHKGGMIDNGNSKKGEEVMSRTLEGEFVFNRPTTEYLIKTMGKRKMDEMNRMGLRGMLK